jgi:hypothetical protein
MATAIGSSPATSEARTKSGVVVDFRRNLHRRRPHIVHAADGAAQHQRAHAVAHAVRQVAPQRERRSCAGYRQQRGQQRGGQPVLHRQPRLEGQHADEMRGPDAAAERHAGADQPGAPRARGAVVAARQHGGGREAGDHANQRGQHHQP